LPYTKLNILQVLPSLHSGGVERGTLEIARYIVGKGHNSYVISSGGRLVDQLQDHGSKHIKMSIGKKSVISFFLIPKIIKFIKKEKINVVHVRSRFPAWIIYLTLLFINKNQRPFFITTVHGFNSSSWYSKIMTKGDKVIVVSNFIKDYIKREYVVDEKKIVLIHRGVSKNIKPFDAFMFNKWKKNFEKEYDYLKNQKILSISARISRTKGIDLFVDLMHKIVIKRKDVHGLIVGDAKSNNYLNQIREKIIKLKLEKHITILGYRHDIFNILQYSDITYCLSTTPEPFGRVVIESIKLGTPIIGFNHGGVKEQLLEIFPEGIVELNNFEELQKLTNKFLVKKPKIKKTKKFTLEEMQEKTLQVYLNLFKF